MAIYDPVAIFNAANNSEAHVVRLLLEQNEIEAHVVEDVSPVGIFMFGHLPQIHNPQVWVDRDSVERAKPLLEEFERSLDEKQVNKVLAETQEGTLEVICEKCQKRTTFPVALQGTVQDCSNCGEFLDVTVEENDFDWSEAEPDE